MYFDSHAHLSSPELLPDVDAILDRARSARVLQVLNICTDAASLSAGLLLAKRHKNIGTSGATPPHTVHLFGDEEFALFSEAARSRNLVAIGETGLDYYYKHAPKEVQQKFLVRYLHLAAEHRLPVIFHCRDAFDDLIVIADREYPEKAPAILHCFTGTLEDMQRAVLRGWFISFSGIVTFKKSEALREVARATPLANLLIETDAPYLAPQSKRGKTNEPAFLPETAATIAALKNISVEEVAKATSANCQALFKIQM